MVLVVVRKDDSSIESQRSLIWRKNEGGIETRGGGVGGLRSDEVETSHQHEKEETKEKEKKTWVKSDLLPTPLQRRKRER